MSHIATVKVKLKDLSLLAEVCHELNLPFDRSQAEVNLYSTKVKAAASFKLKGWNFPVAVLPNGTVQYDNYNGAWGDIKQLHQVLRRYSERITYRQAQRMGMAVRREEGRDGGVVLRLMA